jgi:hypothetical protein
VAGIAEMAAAFPELVADVPGTVGVSTLAFDVPGTVGVNMLTFDVPGTVGVSKLAFDVPGTVGVKTLLMSKSDISFNCDCRSGDGDRTRTLP